MLFTSHPGRPPRQGYNLGAEGPNREEIGFKAPPPPAPPGGPARGCPGQAIDSFDFIRKIVDFRHQRGIVLKMFTPALARQMKSSALMGERPATERGKRRFVELLAGAQAAGRPPPLELRDFSGYSSVSTEPLPPETSR